MFWVNYDGSPYRWWSSGWQHAFLGWTACRAAGHIFISQSPMGLAKIEEPPGEVISISGTEEGFFEGVWFVGTIRNPGAFGYWYNFHRARKEVLEALSLGQNASSWKMLPKVAWGHCKFSNHFNPDNLIAPWHSEYLGLSGSVRSAPLLMIMLTLKSDTLHGTFIDVFCYEEQLC